MNRWIQRIVTFASITSALALVPAAAFAQDTSGAPPKGAHHGKHHRGQHQQGLIGAALKLDSLSPEQRAQIEQLVQERRAASVPVRQADAQLLAVLAQQVEGAKVDAQAQAPSLAAERAAMMGEQQVDRVTLARLHAILTPAQRNQLVDAIEAHAGHGQPGAEGKARQFRGGFGGNGNAKLGLSPEQKAQIKANLGGTGQRPAQGEWAAKRAEMKSALESFRGDSFNPGAMVRPMNKAEREVRLTNAMIPVLTPNQRATLATQLRNRAAHETRS
jgi:Spy/CpxP family protein refolding chaperone